MKRPVLAPRLYPFLNKVLFSSRGTRSAKDGALSIEEISPAETSDFPPVLMLDGDWDRITAFQRQTTPELERIRVAGGMRENQATLRYTYRDVLATPRGQYMLGKSLNHKGPVPLQALLSGPIPRYSKGYCAQTSVTRDYFGHWLKDGLPSALLRRPDEALYLPVKEGWDHAHAYVRLLGWDPTPGQLAYFEEMSLCVDIGQNASRRARISQIHDHLKQDIAASSAPGAFLRRGNTGVARLVVNEDEIAELLAARGFNICHASDDLATIRRACAGVPCVVSMEGSHWGNAYFAARRGALHVTFNPCDRFNCHYADFMPALDQRLATLVVGQAEGGYYVDPERLLRLIDLGRAQSGM
ncbi:uncharacterized protein DUF563 [Litoreibacter meonggei]|uniref:Uncharacterized protein DUF563 n=1 Tax=Litoreibacter meonggei TaxID=1049199 RepID=A0A497UYG6_9RHOB|nr:glycosyltransferase 61 family protein [Litoreibacter meonggei]RLJ36211.1 uncharacterized protein DUF563 [Litoreibacter meonggei]